MFLLGSLFFVFYANAEPDVFGTFRLESAIDDTQNVTIIDSTAIKMSGNLELAEIIRMAPGMQMSYLSDSDAALTYHSSTFGTARRMQVMIDGVSIFTAGLPVVKWSALPVIKEDIERIEVIRDSGSSKYGSNGFMGVINIITKSTLYIEDDYFFSTTYSNQKKTNLLRTNINLGSLGGISALFKSEDWEYFVPKSTNTRKNNSTNTFKLRYDLDDNNHTLNIWAGVNKGTYKPDVTPVVFDSRNQSDVGNTIYSARYAYSNERFRWDITTQSLSTIWDSKFQQCYPTFSVEPNITSLYRLNPSLVNRILNRETIEPNSLTSEEAILVTAYQNTVSELGELMLASTCGDAHLDVDSSRDTIDSYFSYAITEYTNALIGINRDNHDIQTQWFLHDLGTVKNSVTRYYSEIDSHINEDLKISASIAHEKHSNIASAGISYSSGMRYSINEQISLKLTYSKSMRIPGVFETNANWTQSITNTTGPLNAPSNHELDFYLNSLGTAELDPEVNKSMALSILGSWNNSSLDIKIFKQKLSSLISEDLFPAGNFTLSNSGNSSISGVELDYQFDFERNSILVVYSYIDIDALENESRLTSENTVNLYLNGTLTPRLQYSLYLSYNDGIGGSETLFKDSEGGQRFLSYGAHIIYSLEPYIKGSELSLGFNGRNENEYTGIPVNKLKKNEELWLRFTYSL